MILLNGKVVFEKEEKKNGYTHFVEVLEDKEAPEIMFRQWDKENHNGETDGAKCFEVSAEYSHSLDISLSNTNERGNRTKKAIMNLSPKEAELLHKFIGDYLEKIKK